MSEATSIVNEVKNRYRSSRISASSANSYYYTASNLSFWQNLDFLSFNVYPIYTTTGSLTTVNAMADAFNTQFSLSSPIMAKLASKDVMITESGCTSSWDSLNSPGLFDPQGIKMPQQIYFNGLFESKWPLKTKDIFAWYFEDLAATNPDYLTALKWGI